MNMTSGRQNQNLEKAADTGKSVHLSASAGSGKTRPALKDRCLDHEDTECVRLGWMECKKLSPVDAVGLKAANVEGKNVIDTRFFREYDERGVGKIHGNIMILFHERGGPLQARR